MIAILDFGGQYAHLIATRVRSMGVFTEIKSPETPATELTKYAGIILSGGPQSVFDPASPQIDKHIFSLGVPVLAICYGHQLMSYTLGGAVVPGTKPEYGPAEIEVTDQESLLFSSLSRKSTVWMSHNDEVTKIPEGFRIVARTKNCPVTAMEHSGKRLFGVQFHPEVVHTKEGNKLLKRFVQICGVENSWEIDNFIESSVQKIREQVGEKKVLLFVSGGVDSTVAFALLEKALPKGSVYGVFVDTGLLRKEERESVERGLKGAGFTEFHTEDARELFLTALKGVHDPEQKRKIIGDLFLEVQKKVLKNLSLDINHWLLGQGTIYPDTIESGATKHAAVIKTHHNRVPEIQKMIEEGRVIEPLADLYKDEVRLLGKKLGLPDALVEKHPFPGPGLGVRVLCSAEHRKTQETFLFEGLEVAVLPIKSVGVQGDGRTYRHPAVLTLGEKSLSWTELGNISADMVSQKKEINRVMLCTSHTTVQNWELVSAFITEERLKILREADYKATKLLKEYEESEGYPYNKEEERVWQFPVILAPISTNGKGESIILRPIYSQEAMTAEFARLPESLIQKMTQEILDIDGISSVFYDITHKPPATIEWE